VELVTGLWTGWWVIDARKSARTLDVFTSDGSHIKLSGDQLVRDEKILPGFSCRVRDLFED